MFKVSVSTVLLYGSECWLANPKIVISELRKRNWTFAWMLTHTRGQKKMKDKVEKAKKVAKLVNLPALMIRRKMKWLGQLLHEDVDVPSRDVLFSKKEWFLPWFFGLSWEEAIELSRDEEDWDDYIEHCVGKHALPLTKADKVSSEEQ